MDTCILREQLTSSKRCCTTRLSRSTTNPRGRPLAEDEALGQLQPSSGRAPRSENTYVVGKRKARNITVLSPGAWCTRFPENSKSLTKSTSLFESSAVQAKLQQYLIATCKVFTTKSTYKYIYKFAFFRFPTSMLKPIVKSENKLITQSAFEHCNMSKPQQPRRKNPGSTGCGRRPSCPRRATGGGSPTRRGSDSGSSGTS